MRPNQIKLVFLSTIFAALISVGVTSEIRAQGRYANTYSREQVDNIIRDLETSGDEFRRDFINELDRSRLSSSQKRTYQNQVTAFENATDRLRSNFDNQNSWWESRNQVQNVIDNSRPLNTTMVSISFRRNIERQWNRLRNDVNKLADTYDLPGIAGGGWMGGPWNPGGPGGPGWGGGTGNAPSWAIGTFYGQHPQYGGTITLTIQRNGSVQSHYGSSTSYGTMNGSNIYMEGVTARASRISNGIRTRGSNGETVNYYRTNPGGGGPGWGGGTGNAPSWAVGTYRARDPETGATITLRINRNGSVQSSAAGATSTGTMNGTTIYMEGVTVTVSQTRNGIETRRTDTGQVTNYRRN